MEEEMPVGVRGGIFWRGLGFPLRWCVRSWMAPQRSACCGMGKGLSLEAGFQLPVAFTSCTQAILVYTVAVEVSAEDHQVT